MYRMIISSLFSYSFSLYLFSFSLWCVACSFFFPFFFLSFLFSSLSFFFPFFFLSFLFSSLSFFFPFFSFLSFFFPFFFLPFLFSSLSFLTIKAEWFIIYLKWWQVIPFKHLWSYIILLIIVVVVAFEHYAFTYKHFCDISFFGFLTRLNMIQYTVFLQLIIKIIITGILISKKKKNIITFFFIQDEWDIK